MHNKRKLIDIKNILKSMKTNILLKPYFVSVAQNNIFRRNFYPFFCIRFVSKPLITFQL